MLYKTRGIVLNYIEYRETSIIARIFTEDFGLQSYIENSVRTSKGRGKIALFQPLTILEMVVYHKKDRDISRISEARCPDPYYNIPTDIKKTTIAIFVAELLSATLKEQTENKPLFGFLQQSLQLLENLEENVVNFHLFFMINLSSYLGFGPTNSKDIVQTLEQYGVSVPTQHIPTLEYLISHEITQEPKLNRTDRVEVLEILIDYYRLNLDGFKGIRSLEILKAVLD